jgi:spermidine synthase
MSTAYVDRRAGRLALYLSGDLQFDAADERRYHEPLALVPIALARQRVDRPLRVLILGGGDGLALRETLRFADVGEAHLVDRDERVLTLGRTELAVLNRHAFDDARVRVHVGDARRFITDARAFDVVIADLTYPRDVGGASLHTVDFYARVRDALAPRGVVAVNAVSPERTPEAFGSIAASLGAARFSVVPYAFALPSFEAEGYGSRWGFLFASPVAIEEADVARMTLPAGVELTAATVRAGMEFPLAASDRMRVAPNRSDELLYYLANATPLPWREPFARLSLTSSRQTSGPRLTVAHGFARWLAAPDGRRSLESLLACVPIAQRDSARTRLLEWAHQAEILYREVDLRAFCDAALARAASLPEAWRRELVELATRVRAGLPSMRELLHATWRVFAVFLLTLLLANILFPDNLYAKHTTGGASGGQASGPAMSFAPRGRASPFRYHDYSGYYVNPFARPVRDAAGRKYDSTPVVFTDPAHGHPAAGALLALTKDVRLLPSGDVAYSARIPRHQFLLRPDRLDVLDSAGNTLFALHPGAALLDDTARAITAQAPLVDRAIAEHRRWLEWTRWGSTLAPGRDAQSEMDELERVARALATARATWAAPVARAAFTPDAQWRAIFPGVYLDSAVPRTGDNVLFVDASGGLHRRFLTPPRTLTDEDRLLYAILTVSNERSARAIVDQWNAVHGAALVHVAARP